MPQVMYERFSPYHYDSATYGISLEPAREYQYIFPRERVAFDRIAYFFEDRDQQNSKLAHARINPMLAEVSEWRKSWENQDRYLFYEKGPGFLLIYDNRPRSDTGVQEARLIKLGGQLSEVYHFCDRIRSKRAIIEKFGDGENESSSRNQSLAKALDALVLQGLLHVEGERYLALATRKKSRQFWPDRY
jgi:hypothetical protein